MSATIPLTPGTAPRVLVTGAGGFLGRALLAELGKPVEQAVLTPRTIEAMDIAWPNPPNSPNIKTTTADIRDHAAVLEACKDKDIVIHAASLVDYGHASPQLLHEVNIDGTRNVIRACEEAGVQGLVYCSTMDVVCGGQAVSGADESLPYPQRFVDAYAESKATAERLVLDANQMGTGSGLRTCAIRPCGMFGEADPYHISSTIREIEKGKLVARLGDGKALFQHVYVGNVAHAHLLAARDLLEMEPQAAGEAYIITDMPALNFFDFMEPIMRELGHPFPPPHRKIPYFVAYAAAFALEAAAWLAKPVATIRPVMTRSSVGILCKDMYFNTNKAERDFGYAPIYSEAESLERTVAYFRAHVPIELP